MNTNESERATIRLGLGLSPKAEVSLGDLVKRSRQRVELIVAGQRELSNLSAEDAFWRSKVFVDEDEYHLEIEIPRAPQVDIVGHKSRARKAGLLSRDDDADQQAIDRAVAVVEKSAEVVTQVADILSTSNDPRVDLHDLERKQNVDTEPARRFIYWKQPDFLVNIDSIETAFRSEVVRSSQQIGVNMNALVTLVPAKTNTVIERCQVHEASGRQGKDGLMAGGTREFRFAKLEGWQRIVLTGARELRIPLTVEAAENISTCSLNFRANDVVMVQNWRYVLTQTIAALQAVDKKMTGINSNKQVFKSVLSEDGFNTREGRFATGSGH